MTRSELERRAESYRNAETRRVAARENLRAAVVTARAEGKTIVWIANSLGWSRQSVYQLLADS